MTDPLIMLIEVSKHFGVVRALQSLSMQLAAGEVLALLGHNGAGKTTTIKLILGITAPSSGKIQVLGENPSSPAARNLRLRIGYLPESVSFYQQLTGLEALRYFARLKRVPISRCPELLEQVGLQHAMNRRIKTYSKGMRQRLGLAQALLRAPALLLLDEPTVGLDPLATQAFFSTLAQLRQQGSGIILCSHVLAGLESHLDKVAILAQGRLCAYGKLDELRRNANLPWRIQALGNWQSDMIIPQLQQLGGKQIQINGTELSLQTELADKLPIARVLLQSSQLETIEVQAPSLEALYAHFNRVETEEDSRVCVKS